MAETNREAPGLIVLGWPMEWVGLSALGRTWAITVKNGALGLTRPGWLPCGNFSRSFVTFLAIPMRQLPRRDIAEPNPLPAYATDSNPAVGNFPGPST